jgi:anaerobic magnesium-protoporphyrin IX monomethyl ester cyclase
VLLPHELQLGFLKFLPGAPIKKMITEYGYKYQSTPPYEFISNNNLSASQLNYLKKFEEVFDIFYNSFLTYFLSTWSLIIYSINLTL